MCFSKLFKKKKEETVDYSGIMLTIRNMKKDTHIKHISENIASKDRYFHGRPEGFNLSYTLYGGLL